jgi:hypothetical protein
MYGSHWLITRTTVLKAQEGDLSSFRVRKKKQTFTKVEGGNIIIFPFF